MTQPADWFTRNLAEQPRRDMLPVEGAGIETLAWGKRGAPGLMFVHGSGANADWWTPFAPFFSASRRVGAFSLSGSGRSDWRETYSMDQHAREILACAEQLGLFDGAAKPWIVAHSMGAIPAARLAATDAGDRFAGLVMVDFGIIPLHLPAMVGKRPAWKNPSYASEEEAIARFRLVPSQPDVARWLVEFIARNSLVQRDDGRWHWRFDPSADEKRGTSHRGKMAPVFARVRCPISFLWGQYSPLMHPDTIAANLAVTPAGTRFVPLAEAYHHLMFDQPIGFVTAIRALLA